MATFPLPAALFPEIKLPSSQLADFAAAREQILAATLSAREQFRGRMHSRLNPARWKALKRRRPLSELLSTPSKAEFTVYRPRHGSRIPRPNDNPSCSPLLVGVGCIKGSLDDIALGLSNASTDAQRRAASLLHRDVVDSRVLTPLEPPSPEAPFDSLNFKWTAHAPTVVASALKTLVRPRDYVYLESCGLRTDPSTGERTFHVLMHSVNISCYRSFEEDMGIVRGAVSLGFLFSDSDADGCVQIFCKGFVDCRGSAIERVAVSEAMDIMVGLCERATIAAASKKLGWLVQQRQEREQHGGIADLTEHFRGRCVDCGANNAAATTLVECEACGRQVCISCQRQASVVFPTAAAAIASHARSSHTIDVCEHCIVFARRVDANRVAVEEAEEAMNASRQFSGRATLPALGFASGERPRLAPIKKRSVSVR